MSADIKIGILEDDAHMRKWLGILIAKHEGMFLVSSEPTLRQAMAALNAGKTADIYLVDIQLPDGSGTDFIKHLKNVSMSKALILTVLGDKVSVMAGLDVGADGYILKDAPPDQIVQSIRDVFNGGNPLSAKISSHLLKAFKDGRQNSVPITPSPLTQRETEILTIFAKGLSYNETATALNVTPHTIRQHVKSIYKKMSVHSRNEAIFEAVKLGWIEL